jgi:hypothetical protein
MRAKKGKLSIDLPEDLRDKALEVTVRSVEETHVEVPSQLFGLLKGRFSESEISEYTKEARASWERNI